MADMYGDPDTIRSVLSEARANLDTLDKALTSIFSPAGAPVLRAVAEHASGTAYDPARDGALMEWAAEVLSTAYLENRKRGQDLAAIHSLLTAAGHDCAPGPGEMLSTVARVLGTPLAPASGGRWDSGSAWGNRVEIQVTQGVRHVMLLPWPGGRFIVVDATGVDIEGVAVLGELLPAADGIYAAFDPYGTLVDRGPAEQMALTLFDAHPDRRGPLDHGITPPDTDAEENSDTALPVHHS